MIRQENRGLARLLVLNRPEKRNALDRAMTEALIAAIDAAEAADDVQTIVVAAEGSVFCAGNDLAEMRALSADRAAERMRLRLSEALLATPGRVGKPVVAAVQGAIIGAGAAFALCCDYLAMTEDSRMSFPEAQHGILPSLIAPVLRRHLPPRLCFDLLTTGRNITAQEALSLGLASRLAARPALLDVAIELATSAARLPPDRLRALKQLCGGDLSDLTPRKTLPAGRGDCR
ncbi:enoyl-CoA hydratase/isomerase family protein (plasmid) [Roseomonas sp. OT10]|uniref:enoyl-CoA hydratase/isomerase family protein n=1 Tax=Roseomonas cutis TaxID=2897332 RepID=UPI001E2B822E|nr:enoyl-CoA hydratase/isomerase family protein [Roseomonas sp. OT10]UFN51533.1 enoyl-CoA hydratase/isomerase family protein [Roseomonas sp. OT10]